MGDLDPFEQSRRELLAEVDRLTAELTEVRKVLKMLKAQQTLKLKRTLKSMVEDQMSLFDSEDG